MSISEIEDILPRYQEIADGNKKSFNVAFDLIDTKFVSVYLGSDKQTSGFNVDIENKEVVFDSAPNSGLLVTIVRAVPVSWESTLHGAINSTSINSLLTHIIASIQTVQEEVSRAVKSNVYDQNEGGQLSEFFLRQLTDAQDILDRSENTLSLLNTTIQNALSSVETARSEAINNINNTYQENLNDINEASSTALSSIGSAKDSAIASIEDLVTSAEESEANAKVSETNAKTSETNAKASETRAQQIADSIVNDSADKDLSNLSTTGQAKFDAKQDKLTSSNAGTGISISNGVISNTQTSAEWGNIEGTLSSQTDLQNALKNKLSKTEDEDVESIKNFLYKLLRTGVFGTSATRSVETVDSNGKGYTSIEAYYANENIYNRLLAHNSTINGSAYLDVRVADNGAGLISAGKGTNVTKLDCSFAGLSSFSVPTPSLADDSYRAINTAWFNDKLQAVNSLPSTITEGSYYLIPES